MEQVYERKAGKCLLFLLQGRTAPLVFNRLTTAVVYALP
jgi:hypothetical protein